MSRRSNVEQLARTVSSAVKRAEDLRHGRLAALERPADASSSVFLRGVALGALVGAAIAGSTIWERRKARERVRRELIDEQAKPAVVEAGD